MLANPAGGVVRGMILAAGAGTRARHLTDSSRNRYSMAKPRFPIVETPVMHHAVLELARIGVKRICANVYSNPDTILNFYGTFGDLSAQGVEVKLYHETGLLGTMGSAVKWMMEEGVADNDTVIVLSGDIATNADLARILQQHHESSADITVGFDPVPWSQVHKYGTASFEGLPQKRRRAAGESDPSYAAYLAGYQREVDEFVRGNSYKALKVTGFAEKVSVEDAPSNCNNASIYVFKGSVIKALWDKGLTPVDDQLPTPFYDFGRHGFPFAFQQDFKFMGVILPDYVYWQDIGDLGKFWLAVMDTLDGYFDRSMWGLGSGSGEPMAFVHPTAHVHSSAYLTPPYFIGAEARVGAGAHVGPRAVVSTHGFVGDNATLVASAMLEPARFHEGDRVRVLEGSGRGGALVDRSIIASGTVHEEQAVLRNIVLTRPDGRTRFAFLEMDSTLSRQRADGKFQGSV